MNKTFQLVWCAATGTWAVTHEHARAHGQRSTRAVRRVIAIIVGAFAMQAALAATVAPPAPTQLPTSGKVTAGQATISQSIAAMTVTQSTTKAIIDWQGFSIGSKALVNFVQPSSSAVALNRVVGSDPSAIYGQLTANGQVFLVNPSGVLFAAHGSTWAAWLPAR